MSDLAESIDLDYHGDQALAPGLLDLAVNVRAEPRPAWLSEAVAVACTQLAAYPDPTGATAAVAGRHARPVAETLLTSGAAEAFSLVARMGPPGRAVVVHPQFTEPERALRLAGHQVRRHVLRPGNHFRLDPAAVPEDADIVVLGNPTNPTGVLHTPGDLLALVRPGRLLVVDEAFMDAVPGEAASLASRSDVPGLVVIRSLTKTWGLAGLRVGYVLAPPEIIVALHSQQAPWSVSTPALAAAVVCSGPQAVREAAQRAVEVDLSRETLRRDLAERGLLCVPGTCGPFLLVRVPGGRTVTGPLRERGIAVRRGDTFPGLGPDWFRVAVRGPAEHAALLAALDTLPVAA